MLTRSALLLFLCATVSVAPAFAQTVQPNQTPPVITPATKPAAKLPPPAPGVTHVEWSQLVKTPVGRFGLELTDEIKALSGKKVRFLGYMVRRDEPVPGAFYLAPYRLDVEEHEAGFADLPPQAVYVSVPYAPGKVVSFSPRPLLLTGTLSVGQKTEEGGNTVSLFQLALDAPPMPKAKPAAKKPAAKPATPAAKPKISPAKPQAKAG